MSPIASCSLEREITLFDDKIIGEVSSFEMCMEISGFSLGFLFYYPGFKF